MEIRVLCPTKYEQSVLLIYMDIMLKYLIYLYMWTIWTTLALQSISHVASVNQPCSSIVIAEELCNSTSCA